MFGVKYSAILPKGKGLRDYGIYSGVGRAEQTPGVMRRHAETSTRGLHCHPMPEGMGGGGGITVAQSEL